MAVRVEGVESMGRPGHLESTGPLILSVLTVETGGCPRVGPGAA
jgi:hypothetical protein